ncbi:nuclear transport factor 2 family protein [Streptomyces hundungensis]|uniref:nuclear transport factor 2 family protein n=1 Tax=Streptomyces hundungensis TaxID=1077946 RepID=UPI0033FD0A9A
MTSLDGEEVAPDPKIEAVNCFFPVYAANDGTAMSAVLAPDIAWTIPGHHPRSGTKRGLDDVVSFCDQLGTAGFKAEPLFIGSNDEYVVDIHRGWTTRGMGQGDTMWALVWHFDSDGQVDRMANLSGDQHQMDNYMWTNFPLAPLPARLAQPLKESA